MRFFNFNSESEMGCITKEQFLFLLKLEKEHLKGSYETFELKRSDLGVVLISDKFEGEQKGLSGRRSFVNMMAVVVPSTEYKGKARVFYLSEVSKGYPRVMEAGFWRSPDEAVKEFCACYGASTMLEIEHKRREYQESKNSSSEM